MGKGDKKTRRGKLFMGTHGVTRPKKGKKSKVVVKKVAKSKTSSKKKEAK